MKLYQTYLSPFPTRVRLLLYAKGLDVEMVRPSGFHGDGAEKGSYLDVNPIGRVPTLQLDDGWTLPESEVICEYLEDAYPEPSLRPRDPKLRARMRLLSRISDTYLVRAMSPLWNVVVHPPKEWDQDLIRAALAEVDQSLGYVDAYIGEQGYAVGDSISQADGALIPMLVLVEHWLPIFRGPALLPRHPKTAEYWRRIQTDPIAARVIAETRQALEESIGRASRARRAGG
jgi:glutathione S-transferase